MGFIGYWLTHPEAIIYNFATALLYPVLFAEVIALGAIVFDAGGFTKELWTRRGRRSLEAMESVAYDARQHLSAGKPDDAAKKMRELKGGMFLEIFAERIAKGRDLHRVRLMKLVSELELDVSRRLERSRALIRVGPILGLMGTLIPISPALVGLARGDVQTLSDNLVIAFSTTVVGLFIGGLAYGITVVRDRHYTQDVSDVEYVLDLLGV